jgi:hypothetical protein
MIRQTNLVAGLFDLLLFGWLVWLADLVDGVA